MYLVLLRLQLCTGQTISTSREELLQVDHGCMEDLEYMATAGHLWDVGYKALHSKDDGYPDLVEEAVEGE